MVAMEKEGVFSTGEEESTQIIKSNINQNAKLSIKSSEQLSNIQSNRFVSDHVDEKLRIAAFNMSAVIKEELSCVNVKTEVDEGDPESVSVDMEEVNKDLSQEENFHSDNEEEATLSDPEYVVTVLTETKPRKKRDKIADRPPNFPCPLCDKVFSYKNSFKHHTKMVHENSFQFCCDECGRKFLNKSSFEVHLEIHNPHRKCEECGKVCTSKHNLIHHMRSHTKDYSFKCFCGKGFFTEQKFNLHLRIHSGEKPFECTECERRFSRKDKLNEHFRRHVGIKLKACTYCDYRGFDSSDIIKHVKRHHPETCIKSS